MIIVSIIVPVLNAESYIKDCLVSLINQDFPKYQYEIIIVDNGSKDNTVNILEEYKKDILILHESKKGAYIARNTGIDISKGKIIAFTDADCIVHKDWLKELYKGFTSDDIGCVVGAVIPYPGKTLVEIYSGNKDLLSQKHTLNSKFLPYGQTANVAFRREVFKKIGNFDQGLMSGGDADISWRMQMTTNFKLTYNSDSVIEHHHRSTFKGLFKQQFRYGFGRILLYKKYGDHMISKTDTSYDIRYNSTNLMKLMLTVVIFYIRSFKRLFGLCDRYQLYEPLLSLLYMSGYVLGKMYGWIKFKKSFFSTL